MPLAQERCLGLQNQHGSWERTLEQGRWWGPSVESGDRAGAFRTHVFSPMSPWVDDCLLGWSSTGQDAVWPEGSPPLPLGQRRQRVQGGWQSSSPIPPWGAGLPRGEPRVLPRGSTLGGACHPQASGRVWLCQLNAEETGHSGSRVRALREKNSKSSKECVCS